MSESLPELSLLAKRLEIPPEFSRYEHISETAILSKIETWKQNTASILGAVRRAVQCEDLPLETQGDVIFATMPFVSQYFSDGNNPGQLLDDEPWITPETGTMALEIISLPVFSPSSELIKQVLNRNLKPIFRSSPHPHLHAETGRNIPKPAGGSMAMQDYYEEQFWKQYPGIEKVVLWCVRGLQQVEYENIWHLLIPPVMTFLDDYEVRYKLHGVMIVQEMLLRVPKDLLKRTGVGGLLGQSLRSCLSHLQSPETPRLLKNAIDASITLTILTTSVSPGEKPTSARFDALSSLLGEGIISSIWIYAEDKPEVVNATLDALPPLLKELGIGSVRFIKALIPQLAHALIPRPLIDPDRNMELSAIRVLDTLLDVCRPRVKPWVETILDAVGRCWVALIDEERAALQTSQLSTSPIVTEMRSQVKQHLQSLCKKLAEVCPSVVEDQYPRLIRADRALFEGLLPHLLGA